MAQKDKSGYWQALKALDVEFEKPYRDYTTDELADIYRRHQQSDEGTPRVEDEPLEQMPMEPPPLPLGDDAPPASFFGLNEPPVQAGTPDPPAPELQQRQAEALDRGMPVQQVAQMKPPVAPADPNEMAGQRLNTKEEDEPIRTDEQGRVWYQEEVRKPAFPKPRGRRVLRYVDPGTKTVQAKVEGGYIETFEVAGDEHRESQVKITLPSYQVGIYRDPRFPFKVHVYNGRQGFDLFEVEQYWGGRELVPETVKRVYVENDLCYDIQSVIRAISAEYRQLQLAGRI